MGDGQRKRRGRPSGLTLDQKFALYQAVQTYLCSDQAKRGSAGKLLVYPFQRHQTQPASLSAKNNTGEQWATNSREQAVRQASIEPCKCTWAPTRPNEGALESCWPTLSNATKLSRPAYQRKNTPAKNRLGETFGGKNSVYLAVRQVPRGKLFHIRSQQAKRGRVGKLIAYPFQQHQTQPASLPAKNMPAKNRLGETFGEKNSVYLAVRQVPRGKLFQTCSEQAK